jgi:hypothetical protein
LEKNNLSCTIKKRTANLRVCRASHKKRTANYFLPCAFSLPCALYKTHGKEALCRAPERKHTTKIFTHDKLRFSCSVCFSYASMHLCACALIDQSRRKEGTKLSLELNIRYNEFVRHLLPASHTTVRFNYYSRQCTYVTYCINWCCSLQYAYVTNCTNCCGFCVIKN